LTVEDLVRPEIRDLRPYETAKQVRGLVRLNANEAPWPADGDAQDGLNRYPEIRPLELHARLAKHYGVSADMVLATRGSSEAIDLLIRAFCRPGTDSIVTVPPTFSMYRVYADIQGASCISVPLRAEQDFTLDPAAVLGACQAHTKLLFVCSPNNPTGALVPLAHIRELAEARADRSLLVVDEAYAEYSEAPSAAGLLQDHENLVVLRTLSKAHSLAGARCGAVLASAKLTALLNRVLAPYALATPVIECALRRLQPDSLERTASAVRRIIGERARVSDALRRRPDVVKVWPSRSNFLLVRFADPDSARERLSAHGILVRELGHEPVLRDCVRISIGKPHENDLLLAALASVAESA
jgi:histidinol-phosphate aminotransferase